MKKILYITEAFGSGVFVLMANSSNMLASRGHEVHLCYSLRWDTFHPLEKYIDPRVTLHHIPMVRNMNPQADIRALMQLTKLIKQLKPDVIHLYSSKAGFLGRLASRLIGKKIPVFYSPQGLAFLQQNFSRMQRGAFLALENLASLAGGTLVASCQSEKDMIRRSLPFAKVILIENAIDVGEVNKRQNNGNKLCLGTTGRIKAQKDPVAFAQLAKSLADKNISFVWIGDGDHPGKASLLDAGVEVTGLLSREDYLNRLADFDIYIQTSLWEGMPIAMMEALIAGIPAVVTDVIGNRDIVDHGETGFLAKNLEEMASYLSRLIEDTNLRKQMGNLARQRSLQRFLFEHFVDKLLKTYNGE